MEQPPIIEVEADGPKKSGGNKLFGCLGKLIPIIVIGGGLFLVIGTVLFAIITVKNPAEEKKKAAAEAAAKAAEEAAKAGEAVEGAASGGEGSEDISMEGTAADVAAREGLAESVGAQAKTPAERAKMLAEKYGHLEEQREGVKAEGDDSISMEEFAGVHGEGVDESVVKRQVQEAKELVKGGASGEVEKTGGEVGQSTRYMISSGTLESAGTDLNYEIIYQVAEDQLHFRFFLMSFEARADEMFQANKGRLSLRFADAEGNAILPVDGAYQLPLSTLSPFEVDGYPVGWVTRGIIETGEQSADGVHTVRVGWKFDADLSDWLAEVKEMRAE